MKPGDLAAALLETKQIIGGALRKGRRLGAERAVSRLKSVKEPLDQGHYRAAWRVIEVGEQEMVVNDSPIAGVIELGARPHPVSDEGREAIREWVIRKGIIETVIQRGKKKGQKRSITRKEAGGDFAAAVEEVVEGIVHKLRTKGQAGHFIVKDRLDAMTQDLKAETDRAIKNAMKDKK